MWVSEVLSTNNQYLTSTSLLPCRVLAGTPLEDTREAMYLDILFDFSFFTNPKAKEKIFENNVALVEADHGK